MDDEVVGAHRDEVDADRIMFAAVDGELELCPDAIVRGDQERVVEPRRLQVEKAAKSAEISVSSGAAGGARHGGDHPHQRIAGGDIDARLGISIGAAGGAFVSHRRLLVISRLDFHARFAKRRGVTVSNFPLLLLRRWWPSLIAALFLCVGGAVLAQIEAGDRGIPPVNSSSDLMASGIEVDVTGDSADEARANGWRLAQRKGWEALFKQVNGGASAPGLPDSTLDGIVSAIVVEHEQIGPGRYIATLGVQFDRARAGQILGISGRIFRSPPYLVMPVLFEGGVAQTFEQRSAWQRAWAEFRTADSTIDYVRTAGTGSDLMLLNPGQMTRRGRSWWRGILDQYGASDVLIPTVRLERMWPGGPMVGYFAARSGPDNELLGTFTLTAANPGQLRQMMNDGVRRIDALYTAALNDGRLRTDPSLIIEAPVTPSELPKLPAVDAATAADATSGNTDVTASDPAATPPPVAAPSRDFSVQVDTPDSASVISIESMLRGVGGVESATTSSLAVGGVSVMRVRYRGDGDALRAALQSAGWRVSGSGGNLRISR